MEFEDFCIVCLDTFDRASAIWSCFTCHAEYHLVCINDWISQHRNSKQIILIDEADNLNLTDGHGVALDRLNRLQNDLNFWSCPKCRQNYSIDDSPNSYYCYCGKVRDPPDDKWLEPHTCGDRCGKYLKPYCGDTCNELCHRGPCGPCPKMINKASCFCGKQIEGPIRCSQRFWSCGSICDKPLSCDEHNCSKVCHEFECGSCEVIVTKNCICGLQSKLVKCSESWQCSKSCKQINEVDRNKCPCGKTKLDTNTSGDGYKQITCNDTCGKLLDCGQHRCTDKCHVGDCGVCRQIVSKNCVCGCTASMVPCHKEFTCNTKCIRWKNCRKHQCKRKCCDPRTACPPCNLICNNVLSCRKHRCQMRCHAGPCYPCQKAIEVTCACGSMKKNVACGANVDVIRKSLTSKCQNPCSIQSKCKHANVHKCHSKDIECPSCKEICGNLMNCAHECQKLCHEAVKNVIRLDKSKLAGPWEALEDGKIEYIRQPCPPCEEQLTLVCMGGHELVSYPCWQKLTSASCGRPCGRLLTCENHYCSLQCHRVTENGVIHLIDGSIKVISSSPFCEEPCGYDCQKPLVKNQCEHPCSKVVCHMGPCPPCNRYIPRKCHCGSLVIHIECHLSANPPPERLCCPARCPKFLVKSCGHQCPRNCHAGDCDSVSMPCRTKVTKTCPCGQRKISVACFKLNKMTFECDPTKCLKNGSLCADTNDMQSNGNIVEESPANNWKPFQLSVKVFIAFLVLFFGVLISFMAVKS